MKKVISLLLVLALTLSLCACGKHRAEPEGTTEEVIEVTTEETTEATTEPTTEETTEPIEEEDEVGVPGVVYNTDSLKVRKGTGVSYEVVKTLRRGANVEIFEQTAVDGTVWGRMKDGWVSMQFISLNHNHSYSRKTTQPTCTKLGYTTYTCDCGDTYQDDRTPTTGHSWSEWVTTQAATTTSSGTEKRTCRVCGETETKDIGRLVEGHTHSYTSKITREATCSSVGIRTFTCTCGNSYTEGIDRLDHKYTSQITQPICTDRGFTTNTCTDCGSSYADKYTPAKGHRYSEKVTAPTCTTGGYTTHTCPDCGSNYRDSQTAALGHAFGEWITSAEPTITTSGVAIHVCSRCNISESKTLPKLEDTRPTEHIHNWGLWNAVLHTCTEDGYETRICKTCSATESRNNYDPASGHSYDLVSSLSATCTTDGANTYRCSGCGASYSDPIASGHSWQHRHTDAVTQESIYIECSCGSRFASVNEWSVHSNAMKDQGDIDHSYHSGKDTIVLEAARDWEECTICGVTK